MARFLSVPFAILANMCSVLKVHRTARIALRTTPAQRRRCYGLLRSAGDVWARVIDRNRRLREQDRPEVAKFPALCTHLLACLSDKAELAGIKVVLVNERGTSSSCLEYHRSVPKSKGCRFSCPHCGHRCHRDLVGTRNIADRGGGSTRAPARVTHRRAGRAPARRDRRRHLLDVRRSCPAPGEDRSRPTSTCVGSMRGCTSRVAR